MLGSYTSITYRWFFFRCNCDECSSEYLQNPNEFQCCLEIEGSVECLSSEMVIEEVGTKPKCVTQHPGSAKFGRVCSWLPTSTRQKTKRSIARLVRKTGRYKLFFNLSSVFKKQRDQHVAQSVFLQKTASD